MKKAFTLAEIMIVLSVIAVLTAILLPAARNAMPNEKVMKFKKGHNILLSTVSELVNSDKYYLDGDLGIKANNELLTANIEQNHSYLIQTFADVLSLSYFSPKIGALPSGGAYFYTFDRSCVSSAVVPAMINSCSNQAVTSETIQDAKARIFDACLVLDSNNAKQVITQDGIWYWDAYPKATLGSTEYDNGTGRRLFTLKDSNGFFTLYKLFCMDIDGVPENATKDDCVNECPFVYGINVEGKIFTSQRVDEWLSKSIQNKD